MTEAISATGMLVPLDQLIDGGERCRKKRRRTSGRATRKARRRDDEMPTEADFEAKGEDDMTRERDLDDARGDEGTLELDRDELGASEFELDAIDADGELVARCAAGEVGAWEELYDQCHVPLLRAIRCLLGQTVPDQNLIDELAARVWYALIDKDGKLLARFDKQRGARLGTFLRHVARDVTARHFRTEIRRRHRERIAGKRHETKRRATGDAEAAMAEFVDTLSPGEQAFLEQHLLGNEPADGEGAVYSQANIWQIASRIRRKLGQFFSTAEDGCGNTAAGDDAGAEAARDGGDAGAEAHPGLRTVGRGDFL